MFNEIRLQIADFLNTFIFNNSLIILNFWHVVHFIFGSVLMFLILRSKIDKELKFNNYFLLFLMLIVWEIFEISFVISGSGLFREESKTDIFYDLIYGMLGGFLLVYFKRVWSLKNGVK